VKENFKKKKIIFMNILPKVFQSAKSLRKIWAGEPEKKYTKITHIKIGDDSTVSSQIPKNLLGLHTMEFTQLTAENLLFYRDTGRKGMNFYMGLLFAYVRQSDMRINSVLRRRKLGVLSKTPVVKCEWKQGKELAELIIKNFGGRIHKLFTDIVEANLQGIKIFEINYEVVDGFIIPKEIKPIPNHLYVRDDIANEYKILNAKELDAIAVRIAGGWAAIDRVDIEKLPRVDIIPEKLLEVKAIDGDDENAFMNGLVNLTIICYFYKVYTQKDLHIFIERFAEPILDAMYEDLNDDARTEMQETIENLKAHGYLIRPKSSEVNLLNDAQKGQAFDIFLETLQYYNSEYTILAVGEEESTQMGDKGSMAALKEKRYVAMDVKAGDEKTIEIAMTDLFKKVFDINFANVEEYATYEYSDMKTLEEQKTLAEVYAGIEKLGYKIPKETVENNFNVELEDKPMPEVPEETTEDDPDNEESETKKKPKLKAADVVSDKEAIKYLVDVFNSVNNNSEEE
jgi:phage gp29-like protein